VELAEFAGKLVWDRGFRKLIITVKRGNRMWGRVIRLG